MRMLNRLSLYGMILAALVLVGAWVVSSLIGSGAQLVQRVEPSDASALFADVGPGTPIGSPQMLIIRDPNAFLEGQGPEGSRLVNETYLREKEIYPLQLVTIQFFRNITMFVAGLGLVLLWGVWWWSGRQTVNSVQHIRAA